MAKKKSALDYISEDIASGNKKSMEKYPRLRKNDKERVSIQEEEKLRKADPDYFDESKRRRGDINLPSDKGIMSGKSRSILEDDKKKKKSGDSKS